MLGAAAVMRTDPSHRAAQAMLAEGGKMLCRLLEHSRRPDRAWIEAVLGYDNPRLCQALI